MTNNWVYFEEVTLLLRKNKNKNPQKLKKQNLSVKVVFSNDLWSGHRTVQILP